MSKLLCETHPTLWRYRTVFQEDVINQASNAKWIQDNTVDVAEHETVKKQLFDAHQSVMAFKAEVERLKKELDLKANDFNDGVQEGLKRGVVEGQRRGFELAKKAALDSCLETCKYHEGFKDGECRAMERVNAVLSKACAAYYRKHQTEKREEDWETAYSNYLAVHYLIVELGLGGEEKP